MTDQRIHGIPEPGAKPGSGETPDNGAAQHSGSDADRLVPDPEAPAGPQAGAAPGADAAPDAEPAPAADAAPDAEAEPGSEAGSGADSVPRPEATPGDGPVDVPALAAKAAKADEYLDLAQRTRAEFENFRKRAAREAAAAQERGAIKLAKELLPALDNLDRALAHAASTEDGNGDASLVTGIKHVHSDLIAALRRAEIEPYSPEGEPFDPQFHEAVAQQPFEGTQPGTVVEVYQRGYRRGENVLRPARVVVAG